MSRPKLLHTFCMLFLSLAGGWLLLCGQVSAAPNQGPNPDDFSESNTYGNDWPGYARRIDYVVATTGNNYIPTTRVKIFMPTPTGTIVIHNHNICYATFRNGGDNFDLPDNGNTNGSSGNSVSYTIGSQTRWGAWDGSSTCDSKTTSIDVSGASVDPNTGMYLYILNAQALPAAAAYMQTFWITAPAGAIISQDSTLSATSGFGMNQAYPITRGNNPSNTPNPPYPYRNYSNWNIKFAPDCSVTSPTTTKVIEMYDDDNLAASPTDNWAVQPRRFSVGVLELDRAGNPLGMLTPSISFPDGSGGFSNVGGGFYQVWTSGNNKRIHLQLTFKRDMKYQFILRDVYQDNTLQFKIPFDNVYYYQPCQTGNFNLQPGVNIEVTDPSGTVVPGNAAEPGDTIAFKYSVNNTGSTPSSRADCTVYGRRLSGYQVSLTPPDNSSDPGYVPPNLSCPPAFGTGNTLLGNETFTTTPGDANTTFCRTLSVNPATPGGGPAATKNCAIVATKPYVRVFGGDVAAGNDFETSPSTCAVNSDAAVVGWNKRSSGGFAGAAAQFGIFALAQISDFATSLGNGSGAANPPDGLSFANTATTPATGQFGGVFGSLDCIRDHYGSPVTNPLPNTNLGAASVSSGEYTAIGPVSLHGILSTSKQVTVYVDGDIIIDGDITFPASWPANTAPMIRLIAKGNIFIGANVSRIDGLFVAQPRAGSAGVIYTCALTTLPVAPVPSGQVYSRCNGRLTVNGAFVARQVQLLRARGTLSQSTTGETNLTTNAAEVFNYGPALWMAQPRVPVGPTADYDAIVSLPPIL